MTPLLALCLVAAADPAGSRLSLAPGYAAAGVIDSPFATQAAAATRDRVYAVSSTTVAEYDRATGKPLRTAIAPGTKHLNSAYVWDGVVYCAHSNYPAKPDTSDVRAFDPKTGELTVFHTFADPPGSLVWCLRDADHWWCCFAHYGADNGKTVLLKLTPGFRELARWTFPPKVVADWDGMSASGGVWDGDSLLVSHHHWKVLYRLRLPKAGGELEFVEAVACPFPGQGIAADPLTGGLVGIDRGAKRVVFVGKP